MTIEESTQAMHHSFLRLLGVADPAAPGPLSDRPAYKRREASGAPPAGRAGTVRSEKYSSERSVVRPITYGGWFLAGGLGVVFAAGMAFG